MQTQTRTTQKHENGGGAPLLERAQIARARAEELDQRMREFVTAQPLLAVGGAVVAGFLLGRLIRR